MTGTKTPIPPNANEIEKKSLEIENQSAEILSENGYNVEQNPKIDSIKNPDYKINGEVFDNIAPTSPSVRNIYDSASEKVLSGQTSNVVINLEGSSALVIDLEKQFLDWPMEGLDKVIIIVQNGKITNIN